ncbi:MAG: hypothetical protein ACFBRM_05350 [Pikeienuella sp.]
MEVKRVSPKPGKQKELGEKIVGWTKDKSSLPELDGSGAVKDVAAFKADMAELVDFPDNVTNVVFIMPEAAADGSFTYYIRLPLKELVEQSLADLKAVEARIADGTATLQDTTYPGLSFYEQFIGTSPLNRQYEDMLYRRIADYTFAHCK